MGGAWIVYNEVFHEKEAERILIVESDIIGAAARPALMFKDRRLAGELMQSMHFDPDISTVKLFTSDGKELFTYRAEGDAAGEGKRIDFRNTPSSVYADGRLRIYRVVTHKYKQVGVIYMESRLIHLSESRNAGIMAVILTTAGCLILGLVLVSRMQKKIAVPISSLASLMRQMGASRDYSLRMNEPVFNSETEDLLVGFNQMAAEIQHNFRTIEKNQENLRQSELRLRNIVELAPVPVIISHPSDGRLLFYNRVAARLFGVDEHSEGPFNTLDFYQYPEQRQVLMEKLKKQGEFYGQELEVVRPDGAPFWISLSMSVIQFQGENALFSAFVDITEQKTVEQILAKNNQALELRVIKRTAELQAAKDELQSTLDNMIDTYYRIHADGTVKWASASVLSLLGYQPSEIAGIHFRDLYVDGQSFSQLAEALQQHGGAVINQKIQLKHKSGHAIWVSISAHLLVDEQGGAGGLEGVVRDITRQVLAEEQRQAMEEKMVHVQRLESLGVLAGGIAHDFNNILASIMGNAELAELNSGDGLPVQKELHNILTGSVRAADLCKQMLAYSGQGAFLKSDVNMSALVDEALQLIDISIPKNISLTLALSNVLPLVHADKTQMHQIIMNLVSNAAESIGDEKQGRISIITSLIQAGSKELASRYIEEERQPGSYVLLEVMDNGCGMDEATMDKIFDPFFTTKFTGRGLGMSALLGIVRSHGGAIQLDSKPGQGADFRILLPLSHGAGEAIVEHSIEPVLKHDVVRTVLVIDDEMTVRAVVERLLDKLGCKVMLAGDGERGVELCQQYRQEIDVVLLDLTMPGMGGIEAMHALRKLDASLPVFICSGYSHEGVVGKFGNMQPSGFLQKPFSLKALSDMLNSIAVRK